MEGEEKVCGGGGGGSWNQLGTAKPCGSTDGGREYGEICGPRRGLPFLGFSFRHAPTGRLTDR